MSPKRQMRRQPLARLSRVSTTLRGESRGGGLGGEGLTSVEGGWRGLKGSKGGESR